MRAKEKSTPQKVKDNETWSWFSDIFSFPGKDFCLIENETCLASPPYIVQLIHYTPLYIKFQRSLYRWVYPEIPHPINNRPGQTSRPS